MSSDPHTNSFPNAKQALITLIRQNNAKLTLPTNANLSKSQTYFLERMLSINQIEQRPACVCDFTLSRSNFRQKIHELRDYIEKVIDGRPSFYKIKGVELPGDTSKLTLTPMGVNTSQLEQLLLNCKNQPPMLHDIRFKIDSDLHDKLLLKGLTPDPTNSCIIINEGLIPNPDPFIHFKLLVYPKHIQLIVGCSKYPLFHSLGGIFNLVFTLGRYIELLRSFVLDSFSIPQVSQWRCVGYHFNKDGNLQIEGQNFDLDFKDFQNCMIRIYTKQFSKNDKRLRIERTESFNKSIEEMSKEVLE